MSCAADSASTTGTLSRTFRCSWSSRRTQRFSRRSLAFPAPQTQYPAPASLWDSGNTVSARLPTLPGPLSQLTDGSVGRLIDPNYRNPVAEEFNVGYSWALNNNSVFEAEYTHVLGLHEDKTINIDQKVPMGVDGSGNVILDRSLDRCFRRCWPACPGKRSQRRIDQPQSLRRHELQLPSTDEPSLLDQCQLHSVMGVWL